MKMHTRRPHRYCRNITRRSEQGQSFIEFALIVPVLFIMLIGATVLAEGLNLKMVMQGAAYEGARVWAKSPVSGDDSRCSPPACDPASGAKNFDMYVKPIVRQYVTNNGFDGAKVYFYSEDDATAQKTLNFYNAKPELVSVIVVYPYDLPIGIFASNFQRIYVRASCTMKRGG